MSNSHLTANVNW